VTERGLVQSSPERGGQLFFDLGVCENDSIKRFFGNDFASNKEAKRERSQLPTKGRECQMSRERVRKIIDLLSGRLQIFTNHGILGIHATLTPFRLSTLLACQIKKPNC